MTRHIFRAHAESEYLGVEIPILCIELDVKTVCSWLDKIALVRGLKAMDNDVCSLSFFDCTGDFMDLYALDESIEEVSELVGKVHEDERAMVELGTDASNSVDDVLADGGTIRTDMDMIEVYEDGICRVGYAKHSNIRLESVRISADELGKLAGGSKLLPCSDRKGACYARGEGCPPPPCTYVPGMPECIKEK